MILLFVSSTLRMTRRTTDSYYLATSCDYKVSHTGDPKSFGYQTARSRWGKILSNIEREVLRTTENDHTLSDDDVRAGRELAIKIKDLDAALLGNKELAPVPDDGGPDVIAYNEELKYLYKPTWLSGPWLYTECYLYRLLHTYFNKSTKFWQAYDMFASDKRSALVSSRKGLLELVKQFNGVVQAITGHDATEDATRKALLEEMLQISLWGNATDLSLLTNMSVEQMESRQGKASRDASKRNVLVDDTAQVESLLFSLNSETSKSIHIVLDNAGFELLADLVLAGYLVESGFASKVVLHGKCMPWFVSDVMAGDLADLIDGFADGTIFADSLAEDKHEVVTAGKYWQGLQNTGKLKFFAEPFWTTAHPYGRMHIVDPPLFDELATAGLVIYKGDLNYRKLTYDGQWPHDTSFEQALGPLARKIDGKGLRTLALRTAKADVAVGLKSGQEKTLPGDWTRTGKYAMISYYDAKS